LGMRERDKKDLGQSVMFNVKQLIEPFLEKLRNNGLNEMQKGFLNILESGLQEIVSPLTRDLVISDKNLTPTQARIANLIKFGKSSKEIAEALNVSIKTVETHRRKIRAKLGLSKKKANLRSYLDRYSNP
jgi:DNA-binding CsgD family transcriptional regulator